MQNISKYFSVVALIELFFFIAVCSMIGFLYTLFLAFISTMLGIILLKKQSRDMLQELHSSISAKRPLYFDTKQNSLAILAGILLIIPGFLTDILGLLCLIPKIGSQLIKLFKAKKVFTEQQTSYTHNARIIEGECWDEESSSKNEQDDKD